MDEKITISRRKLEKLESITFKLSIDKERTDLGRSYSEGKWTIYHGLLTYGGEYLDERLEFYESLLAEE